MKRSVVKASIAIVIPDRHNRDQLPGTTTITTSNVIEVCRFESADRSSFKETLFWVGNKEFWARRMRRCYCRWWSSGIGVCKCSGCASLTSGNLSIFYSFSAANKVLRDSLKVTLVEGGDLGKVRAWEMPPNAYSNRVVSLTNASQDFLDGRSCSIPASTPGFSL